jgi:hypothetical protein
VCIAFSIIAHSSVTLATVLISALYLWLRYFALA